MPTLIPTKALLYFEPTLRSRLAKGRFSTRNETLALVRDDGGPPLRIWKPYTTKVYPFQDYGVVPVVTADEMGFGNPPGSYAKTPSLDILALGDSFTWCHAVRPQDTWAVQLGALTGRSSYNLGKGGIGLYEEIQILKQFGLSRSPQIVIVNVYEGNDIRDADHYHQYRGGGQDSASVARRQWHGSVWGHHSYIYNLIAGGRDALVTRAERKADEARVDFRFQIGPPHRAIQFNRGQGSLDEVVYAQRVRAGRIRFELFDEALQTLVTLAAAHDFQLIVAYTPTAYIVYAPVTFKDPDLNDLFTWFSDQQRAYFAKKGKELGYLFIDLTPSLRAAAIEIDPSRLLYYPSSLHYTARGHQIVAGTLATALQQL